MLLTPVHSPCYTQAGALRANRSCVASIATKGVCALSKEPFSFLSHKFIHPLVLQRNVLTRFREPEASHLATPLQAKSASAFTPSLAATAATPLSITHTVEFYFGRHCEYGEQYAVVGNVPELGSWDVQHAVRMTWHDGDVWKCEVPIRCGEEIEFKFIKINDKNECLAWESLAEREGETPCGGVDLQFPTGTEESLRDAVWESTYSSDSVTLTDVSRKTSKAVSTVTAAAAPAVGKVVAVDKNGKVSIVSSGGAEGVSDSMTKSDMGKLDSSGAMKNGNDGAMSSTAATATGAMGVSPLATADRNLVLRVDPGFKKFSGYLVKVKSAKASESRKSGMGSSGSLDVMGSNDDLFKSSPMRAEDVELKGNLRNTGY